MKEQKIWGGICDPWGPPYDQPDSEYLYRVSECCH